MEKNSPRIIVFLLIGIMLSVLKAVNVSFVPAGQSTAYGRYNTEVTNSSVPAGDGGFTMSGNTMATGVLYRIEVSFDVGTSWYYQFSSMTASTGTAYSNGRFESDNSGDANISISHEVFSALAAWPGNDGTIRLRVKDTDNGTYYPGVSGVDWILDLTRPTISTASIASNNGTNIAYATTGNTITLNITASENLMNSGGQVIAGNISGLDFIASQGADATQWTIANTVSTHAEAVATFTVTYYDENYNVGASPLQATTDGSTVTVDKTSPEMTVTIASNNDVTSLAKHGDVVTLSISANETLFEAPTVGIAANTSATVNPTTASSSYSATHTMNQANDPQTAVTFSIAGIKDNAGNTVSTIAATTDASSVTFDYTAPTLTSVSSASNNSLSSSRAKSDDVVTLTFYSNEQIQTPVVLIESESSYESNASGDKTSWTAIKTMDADDADGAVDFTINFSDLAGNAGTEVDISGLTSGGVTYDNTAPTTTSVTVASSSNNSGYAISGDVVSVTVVAAEDLQGDEDATPYGITSASIASRSITGTDISKISATNWKMSVELNGSETSGPAPYSFVMTDLTGNQSTISSDISSITIDNAVPTLSSVNIASNGSNTSYAKAGDEIKVTFTASENLSTTTAPTGTIASTASTVSSVGGSQVNYESSITTNTSTTEGTVAFTLAFQDPAGNTATANAVTDGTSVIFDRTTPLMSYVTMASDNSNPLYAKPGSLVTLSFKATDKLNATPTVTMFTAGATTSGSNTDSTWTSIQTMVAGRANGAIPFTLDFTDMAGNDGTRIVAVANDNDGVVIFDDNIPELTQASIASNNSNGATLAKVGDQITLTIVSDENIQTPTVVIAGRTGTGAASLTDATSGLALYSSTYTMLDGDTEGTVAFTIDFSDIAGNAGTQVAAIIADADGSGVTFDKTAPSFTTGTGASVSIVSDNDDNTVAIVGDEITLTLTSTEAIKTGSDPSVTINGNTASVARNTATSFTATYTMSTTDGTSDISSIPFTISGYEDVVGNAGETVTSSTTDGTAVKFDPTAPTLSNVDMVSVNTDNSAYAKLGDVIKLTFESSETINTPTVSMLGSTADITITQPQANSWQALKTVAAGHAETEVVFSITFADPAGNAGVNASGGAVVSTLSTGNTLVTVDRTAPSVTTVDIASNNSLPQYARPGDIITLTIITDEAIQTPAITIGSNTAPTVTAVAGFNNQKWTAVHTAGNVETLGQMSFLIDFTDLASNDGTDHNSILNDDDGEYVSYDNTAPVLSNVNFVSDNSINTGYGRVGSVVTVTFDANEELLTSTVIVLVNGQAATVSKSSAWNTSVEGWTASYSLPSSMDDSEGTGYTVPYSINYSDQFNLSGTEVTHITPGVAGGVIFDKTPPEITTFTYVSDNDNLPTRAKVDDVITTTMKGDEPLAELILTVEGESVTETAVGGKLDSTWTANYAMQSSDTEGPVNLVFDYKDYAGNSGETKNTTTDGVTITFDKTNPTLSSVGILSNNRYDTSKAKAGDQVTVSFTADENLKSSPVVTIVSNTATVAQGADATQWTATYTMQESDDDGAITFNIAFSDLAANDGTAVAATNDGSSVTFDNTATTLGVDNFVDLDSDSDTGVSDNDNLTNDTTPTFTITDLSTANATTDTLILFVNDVRMDSAAISTNSVSLTVPDDKALSHSLNTYAVFVKSRDLTGNISEFSPGVNITIDTQVPSVGDALDLAVGDDSGFSNTDNITNQTTPEITVAGLAPVADPSTAVYDSIRIYQDVASLSITDQFLTGFILDQDGISKTHELTTALTEDVYTFSYKVVDPAGNISSMSSDLEVTIDLTAPATPSAPDLLDDGNGDGVDEYDTGTSNSDNLTNLTTVVFRVTGLTATDSVYIVDTDNSDAVVAGETIVHAQTDITVENLTSGIYAAKTKDLAGNESIKSDLLTVTVDTQAPDLTAATAVIIDLIDASDTGLANDDNITNETLPTFEITNLTTTDSVYLYRVVAGQADELVSRGYASNSTLSLTTASDKTFTENNFSIKVKAKDYAGNLSDYSNELAIVVDTTPFTIASTPDLFTDDDSGVSDSDNITSNRTPRFTLDQLASTEDFLELYVTNAAGATSLSTSGTKDLDESSDTLIVPSNLSAGTYSFQYRVTDAAGNISSLSSGTPVTIDYTSPDAPADLDLIASDDTGVSSTDNLTNTASMSITSSGYVTGEYGLLYQDGDTPTLIQTVNLASSTATFTVTNSASGTFDYYVIAEDVAGNKTTKADSPTLQVVVDQVFPDVSGYVIALDSGSDTGIADDNAGSNTTPTFTITNPASGLTSTDSLIIYYALKPISQNSGSGLNGVAKRYATLVIDEITSESLAGTGFDENADGTIDDGAYSITAKVRDYAGNLSDASPELVYRLDTTVPSADLSAPDLTAGDDTGYDNTDNNTNQTEPSFLISGLDAYKRDKVTLSGLKGFTTTELVSGFAADDPPLITLTVPEDSELGEGTWNMTYTVEDSAGNITSSSTALSITVDVTAPSVPTLSDLQTAYDTGVSTTDNLTNLNTLRVTVKGLAANDIGEMYLWDGEGDFDVAADTKIDSAILNTDADADGITDSLFFEPSGLVDGVISTFYTTSTDAAGNQSTPSPGLEVTVDQTAPDVSEYGIVLDAGSDTGISGDNAGSNTTPTFTITNSADLDGNGAADGLASTDSLIIFYALKPISQNPGSGLNGVAKRYSTLVVDAVSESLAGTGFDENADGTIDDGAYSITAKVRDYAGNLSDASPELIYRLDRVAPTADLSAPDLIANDDTGYDNADNLTKQRAPSFLISGLDPYKQDSVALYAQKGFTNYFAIAGTGANDPPQVTLTVPWVDADGEDDIDVGEGFGLDEGAWSITYTVKDSAGNITSASTALSITVDVTAPSAPTLSDLQTAYDTGESTIDNLTNLNTLRVTVKGLAANDIGEMYLWDGEGDFDVAADTKIDSAILNTDADADGITDSLFFEPSGLVDGVISTFYTTSTDAAGNQSTPSPGLEVTVDQTAPDVSGVTIDLKNTSDTGELDDDDISKDDTPTFSVSGLNVTDRVFLYFNGADSVNVVATTDSEDITGSLSNDATYAVTLKARDYAGNLSTAVSGAAPVDYVLDRVAPVGYDPDNPNISIEFSAPDLISDSDTGFDDSDNITNLPNPTFRINNLNPFEQNKVVLFAQRGFINTPADSANSIGFQSTLDIAIPWVDANEDGIPDAGEGFALEEGTHALSYTVRDLAGNITSASPTLSVAIDTTPPPPLGLPDLPDTLDTGESEFDNFTNLSSIIIDQTDTIPGYKWILFSVEDFDGDSLYDPTVDNVVTKLDSQQTPTPWVDINGDGIKDPGEGGQNNDGLDLDGDGTADGTRTETVSIDVSVDPVYHFYAVHEDTAGNQSSNSEALTVVVDFTQPECDITYNDADNLVKAADGTVDAIFTFTESINDLNGPPTINISYGDDSEETPFDTTVALSKQDAADDKIWIFPIPLDLPSILNYDGFAILTVNATDIYGNAVPSGNITGANELRIDNTPARFFNFSSGDSSYNNDSAMAVISWEMDEPNQSEEIASCDVIFNNLDDETAYSTSLATADLTETDPGIPRTPGILPGWGVDGGPLELTEGLYEVIFSSLDLAGNTGNDTINFFTYDTTRPTVDMVFSRLYATDLDTVIITATFNEPIIVDPPPIFTMELPELPGNVTTGGDMVLVNPEEYYDDYGSDGGPGTEDSDGTEGNGVYDFGEPFIDDNGDGIWTAGDLINWKYTYILGGDFDGDGVNEPTDLDGAVSNITITNAHDLANNLFPADSVNILDVDGDGVAGDVLTFDNFNGTATFSYENITNPTLTNVGIGGDTIRITVTTDEPILATNPVPTVNLEYNALDSLVEGTIGTINLSQNPDANTWVFDFTISDLSTDDGFIDFDFVGNDLAENPIELFVSDSIFAVDNLPPAFDTTLSVRIIGGNPVQGYITGNTTNIGVWVPIQAFVDDTTLQEGGQVEIQFRNKTRGLAPPAGWKQIGENDLIITSGDSFEFIRPIEDLYAVMDTASSGNDGLQPGDSIYVRARVIDKHANVTAFEISRDKLVYDPYGPSIGSIISGDFGITNDGSQYYQISDDQIDIEWSSFQESGIGGSGLERYELRIRKKSWADPELELFFGPELGDTISSIDTIFSQELFLEHEMRYVAEIVAYDSAGNSSEILRSDTLIRQNSNPLIATIEDQSIYEDLFWSDTVQITDPDFNVLQGDSHTYTITTDILTNAFLEGQARGGTSYSVFLELGAMIQDDYYNGNEITISTGTGGPQVRTILDYHGGTRMVTIDTTGLTTWDNNPIAGTLYEIRRSTVIIDSISGILIWTPTQEDLGEWNIDVTVTDAYELTHTETFTLTLIAQNDAPGLFLSDSVLISGESEGVIAWEEDTELAVKCTLSNFIYDVDNDVALELDWAAVIYDTSQLNEDYPLGQVIVGPDTPNDIRARLTREYLGFDPSNSAANGQQLSLDIIQLINNTRNNPLLEVSIDLADTSGDGINETVIATFASDSNYHGSNHRIEFIAIDPMGLETRDTIIVNVLPKNDPPTIATLPDTVVNESDSIWLEFGSYTTDVDDTSLTFTVTALTNEEKITISPSEFISYGLGDSVLFLPEKLWSNEATIQVVVADEDTSAISTFTLDILRVMRPHLSVSVVQNNAFSNFLQVMVIDSLSKTTYLSMEVQNQDIMIDTIADYTYTGDVTFEASGNYSIDIYANANVGDTTVSESFSLAAGRATSRWMGRSYDGQFSVAGNAGSILYDQSFLIADSTLFDETFHDKASYVFGNEDFSFNQPIEVKFANDRKDLAIYRRKNSVTWEELPSLTMEGEIFTLSEQSGYFRLGPKTIIVPEQTNIYQNYPNPFNPTTTVMYDIGLMDGLSQNVSINIFNLLGQHITALVENKDQIGQFKVQWDGYDKFGQQMSSGVYFIQLTTKTGIVKNKKMMLLK